MQIRRRYLIQRSRRYKARNDLTIKYFRKYQSISSGLRFDFPGF